MFWASGSAIGLPYDVTAAYLAAGQFEEIIMHELTHINALGYNYLVS